VPICVPDLQRSKRRIYFIRCILQRHIISWEWNPRECFKSNHARDVVKHWQLDWNKRFGDLGKRYSRMEFDNLSGVHQRKHCDSKQHHDRTGFCRHYCNAWNGNWAFGCCWISRRTICQRV